MNLPSTEDECLVFEDWCLENDTHPFELTCTDPAELWSLTLYGNGYGDGYGGGSGYGWGDGFGYGYANGDGVGALELLYKRGRRSDCQGKQLAKPF